MLLSADWQVVTGVSKDRNTFFSVNIRKRVNHVLLLDRVFEGEIFFFWNVGNHLPLDTT